MTSNNLLVIAYVSRVTTSFGKQDPAILVEDVINLK